MKETTWSWEQKSQEDIDRQIKRGLDLYQKWEGWRDDEIWTADALEANIQEKGDYDYLIYRARHSRTSDNIYDC